MNILQKVKHSRSSFNYHRFKNIKTRLENDALDKVFMSNILYFASNY